MPDKYNIKKKEIDVCKIIDYVMIINNSLEIIEMKYPRQLDKFAKKYLEKIKIASKNIEELTTKIIKK